ncbi:MAG TPA: radical SAM protein [Pseudonocardiaceae bacterium]|nr:radical SAM protein [Pseudonocardiaceae bacterium]
MPDSAPSGSVLPDVRRGALSASDFKLNSVDLYVTSTCNRRCPYCFLSDEFLDSRSGMSLDTVRSIVDWASAGGNVGEITLLGGEPSLHGEFVAILDVIRSAGLAARVVTNGSKKFRIALDGPEMAKKLSRVAVSLDAPTAEQFDRLRGRRAFADVMATIDKLRSLSIPFDINYTVMKSTLPSVTAMLDFAEELGADRLNMHWFSAAGRAREWAREEIIDAVEWRDQVLSRVREYRSPRSSYTVDCELGYAYGLPGEDPTACAVRGRTNLQFFPSGSVFSCGMLVEDDSRSAYVWSDGVLTLRQTESELWQTERGTNCVGCPLRVQSGGFTPLCIYNRLKT